jgi:hypothetical protein
MRHDNALAEVSKPSGAIQTAITTSIALPVVVGGAMLLYALDDITAKMTPGYATLMARAMVGAAIVPWAIIALGRLKVLLGQVEREIYQATGWKADLDMDGETIKELPERQVIRTIPVRANNMPDDIPIIRLPDGRDIAGDKLRDFITYAGIVGLGVDAWKGRGWTRQEWETARDALSIYNLATARQNGVVGKMLASPGQCMRAFGL